MSAADAIATLRPRDADFVIVFSTIAVSDAELAGRLGLERKLAAEILRGLGVPAPSDRARRSGAVADLRSRVASPMPR